MLYQLKRAGISHVQLDLVTVCTSVVRPVLEYTCPVWHTNLSKYLSDSIELIQNRALKSIFPGMSYNDILNDTGLRTLKERRDVLCMKYFVEIQGSAHKLNGLLPAIRKVYYDLRPGFNRFPLARYRTNRYGNSLIPWGLTVNLFCFFKINICNFSNIVWLLCYAISCELCVVVARLMLVVLYIM